MQGREHARHAMAVTAGSASQRAGEKPLRGTIESPDVTAWSYRVPATDVTHAWAWTW